MKRKFKRGTFDPEFELKKWPIPPKSICTNAFCRLMGVVSPSLMMRAPEDEVFNHKIALFKYLYYKRKLKKYQYKILYREVRRERKDRDIFNIYYNKLEQKLRDEYGR